MVTAQVTFTLLKMIFIMYAAGLCFGFRNTPAQKVWGDVRVSAGKIGIPCRYFFRSPVKENVQRLSEKAHITDDGKQDTFLQVDFCCFPER